MELDEKFARVSSPVERPSTLTKLCFITFFFSGSMTLFSFGGLFFSGWLADFISSFVNEYYRISASVFLLFFTIMFILFGSSLIGALFMFKLKRIGFWIYLASNIIMLALAFFVVMNTFNVLFIIGNILFIILYALQLKHLK